MHTLKLKVNDRVYDKLMWLLSKFNKDEIEVIADTSDFASHQKYLAEELSEIQKNEATFIELDEAEKRLEEVINKHENSI